MNELGGVRFGTEIAAAAKAYGLNPKLLAAVAAQETGGPGATSGNNIVGDNGHGHGLFQIDDRTWAFAKTPAAMDPAQNATMAASILADDLKRYGSVPRALSAYNAGSPTATGTQTTWADGVTLGYSDSVLRHLAELGGSSSEQLLADNRETLGSVNALATYSGAAPQPRNLPAFAPAPYAAAAMPPSTTAPSPFTPARSWSSLSPQSNSDADSSGATADEGMADLVGGGDVFDPGSDA